MECNSTTNFESTSEPKTLATYSKSFIARYSPTVHEKPVELLDTACTTHNLPEDSNEVHTVG
jgi:hypothetical protein